MRRDGTEARLETQYAAPLPFCAFYHHTSLIGAISEDSSRSTVQETEVPLYVGHCHYRFVSQSLETQTLAEWLLLIN